MTWKKTWSYLPIDYTTTIGTVENLTLRTRFWNNLNGSKVKIKFSNRFGSEPLILEQVVIGAEEAGKMAQTAGVTCGGRENIVLAPGEEKYSDEIPLCVSAGISLVISCYIRERTNIQSACATWSRESWRTTCFPGGNFVRSQEQAGEPCHKLFPFIGAEEIKYDIAVGVTDILVFTEDDVKELALFGDSITHMSYYSDAFMGELYERYPGKVSVTNKGYGGNRILRDASYIPDIPGNGACAGAAGIKRFERDVFGDGTPDVICILEGTNDLMHPYFFNRMEELPRAEEICDALTEFAETAHERGSEIYFSTILPMRDGSYTFGEAGEEERLKINRWIREQHFSDGVFDFATEMEDSGHAGRLKETLHIGDCLHPNAAGGEVMARIVLENLQYAQRKRNES